MNQWTSLLTKTLGMMLVTMPLALTASAEITMQNVQIQNCASKGDLCLTVKAPQAQVSSTKTIYFMKDIELVIGSSKGQTEKSVKSQGYLDFDSNHLVLQSIDNKGTLTEEVYNLTTLQKRVFVTR
ncbi:hypothetical protein [Bdellovibrio sp. HCB337]|uniref:hypothetical protein n=1 Tax=Bdellovibrio sp. HCB337 TaxID=3394358 RepID=UPI0039A70331